MTEIDSSREMAIHTIKVMTTFKQWFERGYIVSLPDEPGVMAYSAWFDPSDPEGEDATYLTAYGALRRLRADPAIPFAMVKSYLMMDGQLDKKTDYFINEFWYSWSDKMKARVITAVIDQASEALLKFTPTPDKLS